MFSKECLSTTCASLSSVTGSSSAAQRSRIVPVVRVEGFLAVAHLPHVLPGQCPEVPLHVLIGIEIPARPLVHPFLHPTALHGGVEDGCREVPRVPDKQYHPALR